MSERMIFSKRKLIIKFFDFFVYEIEVFSECEIRDDKIDILHNIAWHQNTKNRE